MTYLHIKKFYYLQLTYLSTVYFDKMSENEISQLKNAFNSELAKRDLELARQKELYQRLLSDSMSANASSKAPMQNESSRGGSSRKFLTRMPLIT